jgi:hypothetical protein
MRPKINMRPYFGQELGPQLEEGENPPKIGITARSDELVTEPK